MASSDPSCSRRAGTQTAASIHLTAFPFFLFFFYKVPLPLFVFITNQKYGPGVLREAALVVHSCNFI